MFFVVKYCIKHVGLVKNVVFLINNCLGAMTTWLLSGIRLLSGNHFLLTGIRWTTIRYYPVSGKMVSGKMVSGTSLNLYIVYRDANLQRT